jgi:hypothetical protein
MVFMAWRPVPAAPTVLSVVVAAVVSGLGVFLWYFLTGAQLAFGPIDAD